MTAQQTHPGLSNPNAFDQFLATNGSEENLVAVPSDYTPSHSYYSPTPEPALKAHDGRSTRATSEQHQGEPLQGHLTNGNTFYTSPPSDPQGSFEPWFDGSNGYISGAEYTTSEEQIGNAENDLFFVERGFGDLGDLSHINNVSHQVDYQQSQSQPVSATSAGSASYIDRPHRHSSGTATITSSHLMSPVLTDASTRDGTSSPPAKLGHVKQEPGYDIHIDTVHQISQFFPSQHTPPMTESSKNTSPEMFNPAQDIVRVPSPMIHVNQYTRGDSPARSAGLKRSRRGSHSSLLSVQANIDSEDEDSDHLASRNVHDPKHREQVGGASISNFKDQTEDSQRAFKNADVVEWISQHSPVSDVSVDLPPEKPTEIGHRRRARSAGAQKLSKANLESLQTTPVDTHIPGPGLLLDVSDIEESSDDSHASIEDEPIDPPKEALNEKPGEALPGVYDELPNQPWEYRVKLWQDPLYNSADPGVKMQPETANEAMMRFKQRNADIETISRVATWGTRRRSESDMRSLFRALTMTSEQDEEAESPNIRGRAGSILQRLRRNSTHRRKDSSPHTHEPPTRPRLGEHTRSGSGGSHVGRKDSLTVPGPVSSGLKRMGSLSKRRQSPKLDTGRAVAAMANPLAAVGQSGPFSPGASSPTGPFAAASNFIRRTRSRSDLRDTSNAGGSNLAGMWSQQGGPPTPALAVHKTEEPQQFAGDDDDEDDDGDEPGIKMNFSMKHELIIPNLDGFRDHVRQVDPRLPRFLVDRIGQEQLRRYKKLLDFKKQHIVAINNRKCSSGKHCMELGGEPTYLPTKNAKEQELAQTGFSVSGPGPSDEEVNELAEGVVTQAQFPPGVPMPPVKRLPAEFECPLCYKVKKFTKPSDWSKHVHEDVQPFTCTFTHCAEPKSFKRKADWVRHENERHRQLEWWKCSMNDCAHICYRKDNFVQHLVREHKLPDSKPKPSKASKPGVRGPSAQKARSKQGQKANETPDENDIVWRMVEECRAETIKSPKEEPCKFCGNICPTWKKLTVHLAKHMEQISMPVLGIVNDKEVTADTIISPIENSQLTSQESSVSPVDHNTSQPTDTFPVTTGAAMPAGFATLNTNQLGYLPDATPYQRHQPQTYPQAWTQGQRDAIAHVRNTQVYPAAQYGNSPPHLNIYGGASSPETGYGGIAHAPAQYGGGATGTGGGGGGYRFPAHPQQDSAGAFASSPTDEGMFHQFPPTTAAGGHAGPTTYPGATAAGMGGGGVYTGGEGMYQQQGGHHQMGVNVNVNGGFDIPMQGYGGVTGAEEAAFVGTDGTGAGHGGHSGHGHGHGHGHGQGGGYMGYGQ